jgi:hypothetical protein
MNINRVFPSLLNRGTCTSGSCPLKGSVRDSLIEWLRGGLDMSWEVSFIKIVIKHVIHSFAHRMKSKYVMWSFEEQLHLVESKMKNYGLIISNSLITEIRYFFFLLSMVNVWIFCPSFLYRRFIFSIFFQGKRVNFFH